MVSMKLQCTSLCYLWGFSGLYFYPFLCPSLFLHLVMVVVFYRLVVSPRSKGRTAPSLWTKARAKHSRAAADGGTRRHIGQLKLVCSVETYTLRLFLPFQPFVSPCSSDWDFQVCEYSEHAAKKLTGFDIPPTVFFTKHSLWGLPKA